MIAMESACPRVVMKHVAGDQRVERRGSAVHDVARVGEHLAGPGAERRGELIEHRQEPAGEVRGRGRCLGGRYPAAFVRREGIGERAADVDPDHVCHRASMRCWVPR
jgi:hypothetical protein